MFWSDWNRKDPIIESSDLDGNEREVLIQKPSVTLPNSLSIDWDSNEICWADAGLKKISKIIINNFNNNKIRVNNEYGFGHLRSWVHHVFLFVGSVYQRSFGGII